MPLSRTKIWMAKLVRLLKKVAMRPSKRVPIRRCRLLALRPMCGLASKVVFCNSDRQARQVGVADGAVGAVVGIVQRAKRRRFLPQW